MTGSVVDASVVIKRLIPEDYSEQARALFTDCLQNGQPLFAPPLLPSEVTNVLYQRTRRQANTISVSDAEQALALFLLLPIRLEASPDLYPRALAFARTHGLRATYDSVYVALAQILGVEVWTADERLVRDVGTTAPWVHWIGNYPLPQSARGSR
jgi:predicted nucleic acid-binding protein